MENSFPPEIFGAKKWKLISAGKTSKGFVKGEGGVGKKVKSKQAKARSGRGESARDCVFLFVKSIRGCHVFLDIEARQRAAPCANVVILLIFGIEQNEIHDVAMLQ
jgi:hypothetical protein